MRSITIKDSLTGEPVELGVEPGGEVGIYACGPTTYGAIHIGNARPYVVFMLLRRFLSSRGYRPRLVVNLTDVNDKIYDAANERGVSSASHADEMIAGYLEDTDALGLGRPDDEPKATETVGPIVALIEDLIGAGHAYESGGDVYFSVRSFDGYGSLSNRDPDQMDQGEEAGAEALKRDPLDFALWKRRKDGEDTFWPSPWGEGRPGWHIECSAMAEELLGVEFAIHGGGADLVFPHHENERAQTEAARGKPLAKIWMHNGMVETSAEAKMAKSVGNIFLLRDAIKAYGAPAVVSFLISGHYRGPIRFSHEALVEAQARNERVREFFRSAERVGGPASEPVDARRTAFTDALADDFNTPKALAELFDLIAAANREPLAGAHNAVAEMLELLGLETLAAVERAVDDAEAEQLLVERERARADRDFERADEIRELLAERGWEVRDTPAGAKLVRSA